MKQKEKFDLVVTGSGLAGLTAAYYASKNRNKSIAVLTKLEKPNFSSYFAQGGIAVSLGKKDSAEKHFRDTVKAGCGLNNRQAVSVLVREGRKRVKELMGLGLEFDSNGKGKPVFGREGAHSLNRVLHIGGDSTGRGLSKFVAGLVKERKNVHFFRKHFLLELAVKGNRCHGAFAQSPMGVKFFESNAVVLAAGGFASLYSKTTNPAGTVGQGITAAHRAGAELMDLEFVQFHPTTYPTKGERNFLLSEAMRGEGAKIVNGKGERFLGRIDSREELAPRDIVSKAIHLEIQKGEKVFLDCTHLGKEFLRKRFPTIYRRTKEHGTDLSKKPVEIGPAAHFTMGGVKTGLDSLSSVSRLYACGECSCNGVHGANRLASNSLLDAVVFGARAGENAVKERKANGLSPEKVPEAGESEKNEEKKEVKEILWSCCGIVRNRGGLLKGLNELKKMELKAGKKRLSFFPRLKSEIELGKLVLGSALAREESRGAHFREDFPKKRAEWRNHSVLKGSLGAKS